VYSDYDEFAWFYNRYWGGLTSISPMAAVFERLILSRLRPGAKLLDLCCGTGQFDALLAEKGFQVTGLDGSERQLEYARSNAPECEFIHADARSFNLAQQYEAALSIYDSLNHIMTLEELECAFSNVLAFLLPGAYFAFDMNMTEALEEQWKGCHCLAESDNAFIMQFSYDGDEKTGQTDITLFRLQQDGSWSRVDLSLWEKAYAEDQITGALCRAGFEEISVEYSDSSMGKGRAFFAARKPL
jgi:SAM-dependent methyltransferase